MKKFFKILTITICFLMVSVLTYATDDLYEGAKGDVSSDIMLIAPNPSNEIKVQLNGEFVDFTDADGNKVEPQIINSRTMVPMRKIFEVFGAEILWDGETRSIKATTEDLEIGLQIDNPVATVKNISGDIKEITLDSVPTIREGRTLVPVRFIAESLDKKVGWDAENRSVIIIDTSFVKEQLKNATPNFYEYLNLNKENLTSYESLGKITGKIKYQDKEESKNNTSLNLSGTMDVKLSDSLMAIDVKLAITGKGILIDKIKEKELNKINASVILDMKEYEMYLYLPEEIIGEIFADKWVKYDMKENEKEVFKIAFSTMESGDKVNALVDTLLGEALTIDSYSELEMFTTSICSFASDDNFEISGRNDKTYKYEIDLEDILDVIEINEEEKEKIEIEIVAEEKVSDGIVKDSTASVLSKINTEIETLEIEFKIKSELESYNEELNLEIPNETYIID